MVMNFGNKISSNRGNTKAGGLFNSLAGKGNKRKNKYKKLTL